MKKRILSLALIVAMVVAMIPATLMSASAAAYDGHGNGHDVYVSETELSLDGKMDAAYENSEKIVVGFQHTAGVTYEAYAVAAPNGFYVYVDVKDSTVDVAGEAAVAAGTGDKAQIYMQVANNTLDAEGKVTETQYSWGYYDCDYAHDASAQNANVKSASAIVDGGYTTEIYLPWSIFTGIQNGFSLDTCKVWFGVQVNNYTLSGDNKGLALNCKPAESYWSGDYSCAGTTAPKKYMVPANLIKSAKTVKDLKYTSFVTDEEITLDGKIDDIYFLSEKITSKKIAVGTYGETTGFETYMVGTKDGFYVFASIYDDTLDKAEAVADGLRNQDGDKFQIYLQLGNGIWTRWGYIDFDYVDGGRHLTTKNTLGYSTDGIQQKAVIWDNQKGWDIEIFIPHNISADDRFASDRNASWTDLNMRVNFQALNETCTDWDDTGYCTARERYGLCYDVTEAQGAWNGPSASGNYFVPVDFSVDPYTIPGTGAITYSSTLNTGDGVKDAGYGDDSVAFIIDKTRSDNFTADNGNEYAKAWVTVTDTKIMAYALINDTTIAASNPSDAFGMFVYFPLTDCAIYFSAGYLRDHIETTARWSGNIFHSTNKNETNTSDGIGETRKWGTSEAGSHFIELGFDLPHAERLALARGEELSIGLLLVHHDKGADGSDHYNRSGYESYTTSDLYAKNSLPRFTVSKASTAANMEVEAGISGANVALGESITVNYYADVPAYVENATMKFTMNGKVTYVAGTRTSATEFKFAFTGIAPQCMGDYIDADLYIGDTLVETLEEYSVLDNISNLESDGMLETDEDYALVADLLAYGAAAQVYANYKTDALVNDGWEDWATVIDTVECDDKVVGDPIADARFTAAGVYHANTNKLYAKISADDISKVKATINGKDAKIETYLDGSFIVYSDDIKVSDFGTVYTFAITTAEGTQTLEYSVNAWCAVKYDAENSATADLAKALYAYGQSALAYLAA